MEKFITTFNQMCFLFLCILIGYFLKKKNLLPEDAATVISKLENYLIMPALLIDSFSANCTIASLSANMKLLLFGIFFVLLQAVLAYFSLPIYHPKDNEKGVFLYSMAVVNFGFMGNSLVLAIFGSEMLYKYLIFSLPLNVLTCSIGYTWLSGGGKFSPKRLINPVMISMLIGILIGISGVSLPSFISKTISGFSSCFSPLAMLLTGIVIGGYDLKKLISDKRVYLLTMIRCLLLPLVLLSLSRLLGLDQQTLTCLIFICAMPLGLNTIVIPAAYGEDTTLGASMAVISNILGLLSVPLFLMLFA